MTSISNRENIKNFLVDSTDDNVMIFISKLKSIFELSIFNLCHMTDLISTEVKMPEAMPDSVKQKTLLGKQGRLSYFQISNSFCAYKTAVTILNINFEVHTMCAL